MEWGPPLGDNNWFAQQRREAAKWLGAGFAVQEENDLGIDQTYDSASSGGGSVGYAGDYSGLACDSGTTAGSSYAYANAGGNVNQIPDVKTGKWMMSFYVKIVADAVSGNGAFLCLIDGSATPIGVGMNGGLTGGSLYVIQWTNTNLTAVSDSDEIGTMPHTWATLQVRGDGTNVFGRILDQTGWVEGPALSGATFPAAGAYWRAGVVDTGTDSFTMDVDKVAVYSAIGDNG